MFKTLGLTSEEVCEVGKWKNVSAFTSHYLRLGASHTVGDKIHSMLHNVSPLGSADPDVNRTERGGLKAADGCLLVVDLFVCAPSPGEPGSGGPISFCRPSGELGIFRVDALFLFPGVTIP